MPKRAVFTGIFGTPWGADDEMLFSDWYKQYSAAQSLSPNPDDALHYYDYRSWFKDMVGGGLLGSSMEPGIHGPSKYKRKGHPRYFLPAEGGGLLNTVTGQIK